MPDPTSERILKFITSARYHPQKPRALARAMGVEEAAYAAFREGVKSLMRSGRIVLGRGNAIMVPQAAGVMIGTYRANARGFGFVVPSAPDAHGDLYIPPGEAIDALTGDTVRARILRSRKREGRQLHEGRIVEILARGDSRYVGELRQEAGRWFVLPDGNTLTVPIEIADVGAKRGHAGDQVVVEITEYPKAGLPARGVLVQRLGRRGQADVVIRSLIHQYHLPETFPAAVQAEARRVTRDFDLDRAMASREDLRNEITFTIDPDDAKDFDDALSLRRVKNNQWELGVHIADVAAFVLHGGALDTEAHERGNSIYFPGFVVPMLPEVLSNGLCSLQEGQPRLVKSVFIRFDAKGRPVGSRFANAVIQSSKRLTYGQATAILEGRTGGFPRPVVETLRELEQLTRTIQQRRFSEGMLTLDLPEVELTLDEKGNVTGAAPADTSFSHTLIEMCMVEANEAVARLFAGLNVPCLRRIHPEPTADIGSKLAQYVRVMRFKLPAKPSREDLRKLLEATRGTPEAFAVHLAILRCFEQAVYSPKNIGHFALASEDYCHFTSPIRRYPDLTVHRLLDLHIQGKLASKKDRRAVRSRADLTELGSHCSFTERRAADAEREAKKVLVLHYLESRIGEVFDGVVTGLANIGVFVQLDQFLIDGLIRFEHLPDDWWELNNRDGVLMGQRSGKQIRIGNRLSVAVAAVDIAARELNLALAELPGRKARTKPDAHKQPPPKARRPAPVSKSGGGPRRKSGGRPRRRRGR
ncbi:MAG: ribonuclease R [Phycisphaerae bacterium]|nr:ribonuclease R [Phycisphaerae bacterium]